VAVVVVVVEEVDEIGVVKAWLLVANASSRMARE